MELCEKYNRKMSEKKLYKIRVMKTVIDGNEGIIDSGVWAEAPSNIVWTEPPTVTWIYGDARENREGFEVEPRSYPNGSFEIAFRNDNDSNGFTVGSSSTNSAFRITSDGTMTAQGTIISGTILNSEPMDASEDNIEP